MSDWVVAAEALQTDAKTAKELAAAKKKLDLFGVLDSAEKHEIPAYTPKQGHSTPIVLLSDTHIEERVDPEDIPGAANVYNPDVARRRFDQFFQRTVLVIESQRHLSKIDDMVLAILGDVITGFLHDDNRESNYMSPTKACLMGEEFINSGIEYLLSHAGMKQIVIPCCYGNHGRTTEKKRAKTAADNSFEWLMYQHIANRWSKEKRLKFHVAAGDHVYIDVAGRVCRFLHGDSINFNGGVGGLSIPALKAVSMWDQIKRADYTFMGHFHQCRDFGHVITNGSMIGYNAYALMAKCAYESPSQMMVFIDHKRGKSSSFRIWTDYMP